MLLDVKNVKKRYDNFELDCSLSIEENRVTGLIGRNGAGKTTLFKSILGLNYMDDGEINILGKRNVDFTSKDKQDIAVTLGETGFSGYLTIASITDVLDAMYDKFDREKFIALCKADGLPIKKKIKDFSTGMKAKLKLRIATSHEAKLLILDEPTSGLDVIARNEVLDSLRKYMEVEGRGILISSHISGDIESLCDDVYLINDGKILLHEDTDVILGQYGLIKTDDREFETLDKKYITYVKKEGYGRSCLTTNRQFYLDNYPRLVVEKGTIDIVLSLMIGGGKI